MKRLFLYLLMTLTFINSVNAKSFTKEATTKPILIQAGKAKQWCPICGMNIKKFYKTSHGSKLKNGTKRQ